jgi:hypothetical protein
MATTVRDYIDKAKKVQSQIGGEIDKIVNSNKDEILDLNREEQMFKKRINVNGSAFGIYAKSYKGIAKGYPKAQGTPYNLYKTGALYEGFNLLSKGNENKIIMDNSDSKKDIYKNLIGLTKENQEVLNYEIIYPELMKFIKTYL